MARGKKPNRNVKKKIFASNHTLKILKSSCIKRKNILDIYVNHFQDNK